MKQKKVIIFLNGLEPQKIPNLDSYEQVICADGAYNYLAKKNIEPDIILGDFDSIHSVDGLSKNISLIEREDQNYTDFEKIIIELSSKYTCFDVYGASGKEQDHYLGNLSVALKYKSKVKIVFYDDFQCYFFADSDTQVKTSIGKKMSLIPFSSVDGVFSTGLKYELKNECLMFNNYISIRNEVVSNTVSIKYRDGDLLIFMEI